MLEPKDLSDIGKIVSESIQEQVPKIVETIIDDRVPKMLEKQTEVVTTTIIEAVGTMIDENVLPLIDDMSTRLTRVEATMVTKEYLDRKLVDHHVRQTAEFDRRYVRLERPAVS
jgi:hypothetical protein